MFHFRWSPRVQSQIQAERSNLRLKQSWRPRRQLVGLIVDRVGQTEAGNACFLSYALSERLRFLLKYDWEQ